MPPTGFRVMPPTVFRVVPRPEDPSPGPDPHEAFRSLVRVVSEFGFLTSITRKTGAALPRPLSRIEGQYSVKRRSLIRYHIQRMSN